MTKGKVTYTPLRMLRTEDRKMLAHCPSFVDGIEVEEQRENARHLAACWNACRGIRTEDLERAANQEDPRMRLELLALTANIAAKEQGE